MDYTNINMTNTGTMVNAGSMSDMGNIGNMGNMGNLMLYDPPYNMPTLPAPEETPFLQFLSLPAHELAARQLSGMSEQWKTQVAKQSVLPDSFYSNGEAHKSEAKFSTNNGQQEFRGAQNPPPPMIARSDLIAEIIRMEAKLRAQFPEVARLAKNITRWYDLFDYFDAYDIQLEGPEFLFAVLSHMAAVNHFEAERENGMKVNVCITSIVIEYMKDTSDQFAE